MEKSSHNSAGSFSSSSSSISEGSASVGSNTNTRASTHIDNSLRSLNKASHKISKPVSRPQGLPYPNPNPNPLLPVHTQQGGGVQNLVAQPQQPTQPPVYNINKSDFRDVVQRLTGSPAHHQTRPPAPPPPQPPRAPPPVSRLHRIRPPPLPLASAAPAPPPLLSPLPPFPAVSAAAESPITAYMRRLRAGEGGGAAPPSPLAFGCAPPALSPGSAAYLATLSPTLLFPTSPGPVPSPQRSDL